MAGRSQAAASRLMSVLSRRQSVVGARDWQIASALGPLLDALSASSSVHDRPLYVGNIACCCGITLFQLDSRSFGVCTQQVNFSSTWRRCGPFPPALGLLQDPRMRQLVNAMVDGIYPLADGKAAFEKAQAKGTLKVQIVMKEPQSATENGSA